MTTTTAMGAKVTERVKAIETNLAACIAAECGPVVLVFARPADGRLVLACQTAEDRTKAAAHLARVHKGVRLESTNDYHFDAEDPEEPRFYAYFEIG